MQWDRDVKDARQEGVTKEGPASVPSHLIEKDSSATRKHQCASDVTFQSMN